MRFGKLGSRRVGSLQVPLKFQIGPLLGGHVRSICTDLGKGSNTPVRGDIEGGKLGALSLSTKAVSRWNAKFPSDRIALFR